MALAAVEIPSTPLSSQFTSFAPSTPSPSPPRDQRRPVLSAANSSHSTSMTKPLNRTWISGTRNSVVPPTSSVYSTVQAPSPIRISEARLANALNNVSIGGKVDQPGSGGKVVRSPGEAARDSITEPSFAEVDVSYDSEHRLSRSSRSDSPVLPQNASNSSPTSATREVQSKPPTRVPTPVAPLASPQQLRSVLKNPASPPQSPTQSSLPPIPPLPSLIAPPPPQPPFTPVLLSAVPAALIDLSQIIVSLETTTATYKTTLRTLTSRPSHLASYLTGLLPTANPHSPASPDSPFSTLFHTHLASQGLLPESKVSLHLFLDRPSAPYAHILTYLRTPTPILPRAAMLSPSSSSRLEALLELRDEAQYLGLEELYRLCTDELRQRQSHGHMRLGSSSGRGDDKTRDFPIPPKMTPPVKRESIVDREQEQQSSRPSSTRSRSETRSPRIKPSKLSSSGGEWI